jgi:GNAT superfamily N-acetyltransferase
MGRMEEALAERLPDLPRWVETRGMLLSARCELLGPPGPGAADLLVRGTDFGLYCVAGSPDLSPLSPALARHGGRAVLCLQEAGEAVAREVPGWPSSRAVIHTHPDPESVSEPAATARMRIGLLSPRDRDGGGLDHVPEPLRTELETALGFAHVAAVFESDLPVAFCYTASETETLWDVSIDTLEPWRGRGLARACCEFLISHMARHGKSPVWGALEQNAPSMKLAERLGFLPVDALTVFEPAEEA